MSVKSETAVMINEAASETAPGENRNRIVQLVFALGWLAFAVLLATPILADSRYLLHVGTMIALHGALAVSLNLLLGYAGQFAISHGAFYGLGAYASALLVTSAGLPFWLAMPLAMLIAAIVAAIIGYPALRYTGGVHLALLTFAFGELARLIAANWDGLTGGPMGLRVLYFPEPVLGFAFSKASGLYALAAAMLLVTMAIVLLVKRSRFGRGLVAIREDEVLASFLGINVLRYKLAAYVLSSAMAAMIGTVYAPIMTFISPELLNVHETISLIGVLILGGIGTFSGPLIGTLIFYGLPEFLRIASFYRLVILGVLIILVVLLVPKGIAGVIRQRLEMYRRGYPLFSWRKLS
ncbi:branched-chain amino acid ABC transporter permease [Zhengella mangrovi]|uniref:Branched-chain amino acid ABC transporter permease n=1 Tax=Zhengella mangrovi TaxID=1982044 RepID=A0A2G1QH80_9HYPH|nr:branched-chain amino acid ABC transporter permease [Zhengella mangrovi]PHP64598.1 branched-chain amino acid ABC transporter permease [Zhengella mangrovi]